MGKTAIRNRKEDMYKAILELKDIQECMDFFEDLCAVSEIQSMEQRFEVAKMLHDEKVYSEIIAKTNVSTATVSRVNRMLNYGTGCLSEIIDRIEKTE